MTEPDASTGRKWFEALSGTDGRHVDGPGSLLLADATLGNARVSYVAVVPDPDGRFIRARHAELGLEEGWFGAKYLTNVIEADKNGIPRPIITVVDSKSQAYGRREELAGIYLAAAALIAAFAEARLAGHPVVALIVGRAVSGSFLELCGQANEIIAFNSPEVIVHAMYKEAAARITRRSVAELDKLGEEIVPLAYDISSFAKLGALYKLLDVANPAVPTQTTVQQVKHVLLEAIASARSGRRDLSKRLESEGAKKFRQASLIVRRKMAEQWAAS
jgi:malonate decarboxylase gamma subunit